MWFLDSTGKLRRALVDSLGHFQIDVLTSPLSALIGEVQAAPTTYTVLDRLKTLATLLAAGLPSALDTGALKVREQNPLASINVGNWPSDYPDAGVAKLLGAGLPSALTSDKLKVRASEIETLLAGGLPSTLDTGALRTREQNPLTEVDVDIAKILNSAVSLTNYLPVGVVYPAGTLINPQAIRLLTSGDVVTAVQATASSLKVEVVQPTVKETFHVDTSGGTNIVIDKLLQGAYTENRSTLSNHGATVDWTYYTTTTRIGKFFPRGARGFISTIGVLCKDGGASGGTITVYISPSPNSGYVASANVTVPPGNAAAWIYATFNRMWLDDSLFIFVLCSTSDMLVSYDRSTPYDAYYSSDSGASWSLNSTRYHFIAVMGGETLLEVPVGGAVRLSDRSTYLYSRVTADAQVKASAGRIHTVTINKCTTAGTLTVYDSTAESGTVIAAIALALNMVPVTLTYDVLAQTGIYAGFDATLAADVTVSYL